MMLHHVLRRRYFEPVTYLVTSSGAGSYTAPAGAVKVSVEAIGGGGDGYANAIGKAASGGGGAYAKSTDIAVTGGSTVVYYSVGAAATDSWVRVGTNSAPTSASQGCLGYRGTDAAAETAGVGGTVGNSVGDTRYAGANGGTGSSASGGGAGGDGGAASGATGGGSGDMKGGDGGESNTNGTAPGGGGGASAITQRTGAIGRVRIIFS